MIHPQLGPRRDMGLEQLCQRNDDVKELILVLISSFGPKGSAMRYLNESAVL